MHRDERPDIRVVVEDVGGRLGGSGMVGCACRVRRAETASRSRGGSIIVVYACVWFFFV